MGLSKILFLALWSTRLTQGMPIVPPCSNQHNDQECEAWSRSGECSSNAGFMQQQCARSCNSCGKVDTVCEGQTPPAKGVGGINQMFERAESMKHLSPTVHSRSPYVITFDHFVTDEEAAAFISTTESHFDRSLAGDVVSPVRTSKQAWCQSGIATECENHPLTKRVHERVVNLTGVPKNNAEFFQVSQAPYSQW